MRDPEESHLKKKKKKGVGGGRQEISNISSLCLLLGYLDLWSIDFASKTDGYFPNYFPNYTQVVILSI